MSISDFKSLDAFIVQRSVSGLHLTDRFFEPGGLSAKLESCHLYSSLDRRRLDCFAKPIRERGVVSEHVSYLAIGCSVWNVGGRRWIWRFAADACRASAVVMKIVMP